MKKIPTVFERQFENHKVVGITDTFTSEKAKAAFEMGIATIKWDGSCCAIIDGELYKRYDAKKGKTPPEGAIPCCRPDPVTGHHPHWVKCDRENPADKWFWAAYDASFENLLALDGTYEAIGKHFNGNPYCFADDKLVPHGKNPIAVRRTFEDVKWYLNVHDIEGIVFWLDEEPVAKIKKSDFGYKWPEHKRRTSNGTYIRDGRLINDLVYRGEAEGTDADLISRQAAIEAFCQMCSRSGIGRSPLCHDCSEIEILKSLPPVELKPVCEDAISRQAAIEAMAPFDTNHELRDTLDALPPVEPKRPRGEWIPCNERLPSNNREVLISLEWGVDIGTFDNGEWRSEWIDHYDDDNVMAWMPLPEPYREDGEE